MRPVSIRVAVVDDEPLFRDGVKLALAQEPDIEVVGEADDATTVVELIGAVSPDLAVVDLALPGRDGISIIKEVRAQFPRVRLLMMTVHDRERDVVDALAAGADGYALKTDPLEMFLEAVRSVARGQRYISPSLRREVVAPALRGGDARGDVLAVLSGREREVFQLIVRGDSNREIAEALGVSEKTVDTHRTRINEKLSCASPSDLVRFAVVNGLVAASDLRQPAGNEKP